MRLTILTVLCMGLLVSVADAQTLRPGQTVQMGKSGSGPADHASVAVNSYLDLCVVYQTRLATGQRLVEGHVLKHQGNGVWSSNGAHHVILGDPALNLYGSLRDNCTKPDVVALDDGSFAVVWPRTDMQDKLVGQVEMARIEIRDAAGQQLLVPAVQTAAPGLGYVIDPLVVCGDAGVMPDLAPIPGAGVAAVYATEDLRTVAGNGDIWRDYSLRLTKVDWFKGPAHPQFVDGPHRLCGDIPMDSDFWTVFSGGMVLPDVVTDDLGHLVVAWEQYRLQGRTGWSGGDRGEIGLRRYEALGSSSQLTLMDEEYFADFYGWLQQRRPVLSSSRLDASNVVLLAWADLTNSPYGSDDAQFKEVLYASSAGQSSSSDRFWHNDPNLDERHPTPSQSSTHQRCFATRDVNNQRLILGSVHASQSTFQVPSPVKYPERVAPFVIETTAPGGQPLSVLVVTYEGSNYNDPDLYRVFLGVFKI